MKKWLQICLIVFIGLTVVFAQTSTQPSNYGTADGSSSQPYEISNIENLYWLSQNSTEWDKHYIQTANIDASASSSWDGGAGWTPIGNSTTKFTGSYNGQGYTIDGLTLDRSSTDTDDVGFFGVVGGNDVIIANLGLTNIIIKGAARVGGLIGHLDSDNSIVQNCYTTGEIYGNYDVGGLIGLVSNTVFDNNTIDIAYNYSECSVTGNDTENNTTASYLGGFAGEVRGTERVYKNYSTGNVINGNRYSGGFAGNLYSSNISNCYSTGDVYKEWDWKDPTGGFSGGIMSGCTIEYSYSTGSIFKSDSSDHNADGFVGEEDSPTYVNNFFDQEASNQSSGTGATGETTTNMKTEATFTNAGWDFSTPVWKMDGSTNSGYPFLKSEYYVAPPTTQASNITFSSVESNQMTVSWTNGDGSNRAVFVKEAVSGTASPTDGTTYSANTTFASGDQIGTSGWYCVYNGTGTSVTVTGLNTSIYTVQVLEYNESSGSQNYLTSTASNNPNTKANSTPMELVFDVTGGDVIELPLYQSVDAPVDWGDGSSNEYTTTGKKSHTYSTGGTYTVKIYGTLVQFGHYTGWTGSDKLTAVNSFGDIGLTSLSGAFINSDNLNSIPSSLPTSITDLSNLFENINQVSITNLTNWDVSNAQNMEQMFLNASNFNQDISGWNVSSATHMRAMFSGASSFNQPIGNWERSGSTVGNVSTMETMFTNASSFNQDISSWDVSSVGNMNAMFEGASSFNSDISTWDVSNVTDMNSMFKGAAAFNQNLNSWDVSSVTDMTYMFNDATSFNGDISNWNVSSVTTMDRMFNGASSFNQDISVWNISNVTDMSFMFSNISLSTANYDSLLTGWASQSVQSNVTFHAGNSNYTSEGSTGRQTLVNDNSWSISDGGQIFKPTVTTDTITNVTNTSANAQGNITDLGGVDVSNYGICWSPSSNPTLENDTTDKGSTSSTGKFTSDMTGLSKNTTYYVRAYAINSVDTSYGSEVSFTTLDLEGSGTESDPYQVSSQQVLQDLSQNPHLWNDHFKQTGDIDASDTKNWNSGKGLSPIGNSTTEFTGSYNGQNYTIDGLYINRPSSSYIALFGDTDGATIENLGVTNVNITGDFIAGAVVANFYDGSITNCYSSGSVEGGNRVGGLVGEASLGPISASHSSCSVTGTGSVGGLIGDNRTSVNNSYSTGDVKGSIEVGGLLGSNSDPVSQSYSTGSVTGDSKVGGLIGQNIYAAIENCYTTSNVTRTSGATAGTFGGFIGSNGNDRFSMTTPGGDISYSYSTGDVVYDGTTDPTDKGFVGASISTPTYTANFFDSDASNQSMAAGATGKTTSELQKVETFTNAGWDFMEETENGSNDYWGINVNENGGYPFLAWQGFEYKEKEQKSDENNPPSASDNSIVINEGDSYNFTKSDFNYQDSDGDEFAGIELVTDETNGDLEYGGTDVVTDKLYTDVSKLVFTPGENESGQEYANFNFKVKDSEGMYSRKYYTLWINVEDVNDPPQFTTEITETSFDEDETIELNISASDPESNDLVYSLESLQEVSDGEKNLLDEFSEISFDSLSGELNWPENYDRAGEYELIFSVTDGQSVVYDTSAIEINNVNRKPEFTQTLSDTSLKNDSELQFTYKAEDPDQDELAFGLKDSIEGMTLSETGTLTWKPGKQPQDQYNLTIYVTDKTDTVNTTTSIKVEDVVSISRVGTGIPEDYSLGNNYPNPFNPTTTIRYGLPQKSKVKISVYNVNGNLIETILNTEKEAGYHRTVWEANGLSTGVYFYRIQADNFTEVKRCIFMK